MCCCDSQLPKPDRLSLVTLRLDSLFTAVMWDGNRFTSIVDASLDTLTKCQLSIAEFQPWSAGNARKARINDKALQAAPPLADAVTGWFKAIQRARADHPVVLAAHDAFNTDGKTLIMGLKKAGVDPRRVFGDAGVVGLLETRKLVKGLPTSTLGRIKERHASLTDSEMNAVGGAQGNRNLYETLVGTDGRVSWHRAYDDAKATAAWLSSADVVQAIPVCISAHSALVDMGQVISMVEVESAKKASKS